MATHDPAAKYQASNIEREEKADDDEQDEKFERAWARRSFEKQDWSAVTQQKFERDYGSRGRSQINHRC